MLFTADVKTVWRAFWQELVSREDPLHEILQSTVYDAVLERSLDGQQIWNFPTDLGDPKNCSFVSFPGWKVAHINGIING